MRDVEKYIAERKKTDPEFAEGFEEGYKEFESVCISKDARRIMPDMLRDFATEVLCKVHLPDGDAALIARYLVDVDLRGVVSHGTRQLQRYGMRCVHPRCVLAYQRQKVRLLCWI